MKLLDQNRKLEVLILNNSCFTNDNIESLEMSPIVSEELEKSWVSDHTDILFYDLNNNRQTAHNSPFFHLGSRFTQTESTSFNRTISLELKN